MDLDIELKLSNWCKRKKSRLKSSKNKYAIVDIVINKEYKINFENWQIALATSQLEEIDYVTEIVDLYVRENLV